MDPNILKKIYKDSVSTKEAVESIDSTMEKLLRFQKKEEKEDVSNYRYAASFYNSFENGSWNLELYPNGHYKYHYNW